MLIIEMKNIIVKICVVIFLIPQLTLAVDNQPGLLYQLREKIASLFLSLEQLQFAQVIHPGFTSIITPRTTPPGEPLGKKQLILNGESAIVRLVSGTTSPNAFHVPTRSGNLHTQGGRYAAFVQGNAVPIRIDLAKRTYFVTSELQADNLVNRDRRISSSSRSELEFDPTLQHGVTYYLEFDVFIDKVSNLTSGRRLSDWRLVQQIIEETANQSPVISLNLDLNGNFQVIRRTRVDSYTSLVSIPATKGKWHRFAYQFTLGSSSRMTVWHDGRQIYTDSRSVVTTQCREGVSTSVCGQASAKFGIYRNFGPDSEFGYNRVHFKSIVLEGFRNP